MFECLEENLRNVINTEVGLVGKTNKSNKYDGEDPLHVVNEVKHLIDVMAPPSAVLGKFAFLITNETHKKWNESLATNSRVGVGEGGHFNKSPATETLKFVAHLDLDSLIFSHLIREYERQWELDEPRRSTQRWSSTIGTMCPDHHHQYACERYKARGADALSETRKSCTCFCSSATDSRFWDFIATTKTLEIATYVRECIVSLAKNAQEVLSIVPSSRTPPRASIPDGKPIFDDPDILPFSLSSMGATTGSEKKVPDVNLTKSHVASASASSDSRYLQIVVHTAIGTDLRLFDGFFRGPYPMGDDREVKTENCCDSHCQKQATRRRPALSHANNAVIARAVRVGIEEATAKITNSSVTNSLQKPIVGKKDDTASLSSSSWLIKIDTRVAVRRSDIDIVKSVAAAHVSSQQQKTSKNENHGSTNLNGGETKESNDFRSETDLCALLEPIPRAVPRHFTSLFSAMSSAACCDDDLTAAKSNGCNTTVSCRARPHIVVTAHFGVASVIASQRNDNTNSNNSTRREVLVFDALEWATSSSLSPSSATVTGRDRSENTRNPSSNSPTPFIGSLGRMLLASTSSSSAFKDKQRTEYFYSLIPKSITCHFLIENLYHEAFELVKVTFGEENSGCVKGVLMSIFHPRHLPARVSQRLLSQGNPGSSSQEIQSLIFDCIVEQCKEVIAKEQAGLKLVIRGHRDGEEGRNGDGVDNIKVGCRASSWATDSHEQSVGIRKAVLGWAKGKLRFIRGVSSPSEESLRLQPTNNAQTFSLLLRAQTELLEINQFIMRAHKEKMCSRIGSTQSTNENTKKEEEVASSTGKGSNPQTNNSSVQQIASSSVSVVESSPSAILQRIHALGLASSSILNDSDLRSMMSLCEIFVEHAILGSKNDHQVFATRTSADMLARKLLFGGVKTETASLLDSHSLAIIDKVCGLRGLGLWTIANCDTTSCSSPAMKNSIVDDGNIPSNPLLVAALCSHRKYRGQVDMTGRRADQKVGETPKDAKVIANRDGDTASSTVSQENKIELDVSSARIFWPCRQALLEYWGRLYSGGGEERQKVPSASFSPPTSLAKEFLTRNKDAQPSLFFSVSEEEERPNLSIFENDVNDLLLVQTVATANNVTQREMPNNSRANAEIRAMSLPNGRLGAVLSVQHPLASERRQIEREDQLYSSLQIAAVSIGLLSVCRYISEAEAYLMMAAVTASTFHGTLTSTRMFRVEFPSSSPLVWPLHIFETENNPQSRGGGPSISILAPPSSVRLWHLVSVFTESVGHCVLVDDSTNNFFASRTLKIASNSGTTPSSCVVAPLIGKLLEIDFDSKISDELSSMNNVKFVSSEIDEVSGGGGGGGGEQQSSFSSSSSVQSAFDDWWERTASTSNRTIARFFGSDKSSLPTDIIEFADELLSEALPST